VGRNNGIDDAQQQVVGEDEKKKQLLEKMKKKKQLIIKMGKRMRKMTARFLKHRSSCS